MVVVIDEIRWIITTFLDKAPKPLKFLLFLLFLVGLVSLIPFFLHLIGFHCNSDLDVVKTSSLKFATNIRIAFMDEDDIINTTSYLPEGITTEGALTYIPVVGLITLLPTEACYRNVCVNNGKFYYSVEDECENETILTPFALDSSTFDFARCVNCDSEWNKTFIRGTFGASETKNLCFDDVYAINDSEQGWVQRLVCDPADRCIPPNYYYFEYDTGLYTCNEPDVCGVNNTEIVSRADSLLEDAEGELLYKTDNDKAYTSAVRLKCDKAFRPQVTFFGIPAFDYRIWLMLGVIFIMFIFLAQIKND